MSISRSSLTLCTTIVTVTALTVGPAPTARAAPALPSGFVLGNDSTGQGTYNLTDFTYLPDGSVLTTGKNGRVTWLHPGVAPARQITQQATSTAGDNGLVGIAVPPDYATSRQVYTIRAAPTGGGNVFRLSRWTATGSAEPTGLINERTILDIPITVDTHGMSDVEVDRDGSLWVSMGDSASPAFADPRSLRSQDLDQPYGKLFHLNPDGSGFSTNPFYQAGNGNSVRSKVYAYGLRSPFRFSFDPTSKAPVLGDVGWNTVEEVDIIRPGQNYKWPCWEGNIQPAGYRDMAACANLSLNTPPLWSYPRTSGASVTGGIVYAGNSYPQQYRGAYFFGDYVSHRLWTLTYDEAGNLSGQPENPGFATDIGGPVSFDSAANGDIVYAGLISGNLRRLSYAPGNAAPTARITTSTDPANRTVSFDATTSFDPEGDTLKYDWDFGDGSPHATTARAAHVYPATPMRFTARLTVTDRLGAKGTTETVVVPANRGPAVTATTTDPAHRYAVGEYVTINGTANDAEDGALAITWTSQEVHCADGSTCHAHPGPAGKGPTMSATFTDHPDTRMEFTATATDSAGVANSATYVAQPRRHQLTLTGNWPASLVIAPGDAATAPVTAGAVVTLTAAEKALDGGASFTRWSDGVTDRSRTYTMTDADVTISAVYTSEIDRRVAAEPALAAMLGAATGPERVDGPVHYRDYTGGRMYWSAATGAHEIHGSILDRYKLLGGHAKFGAPATDETATAGNTGAFNHFVGTPATMTASIFWSQSTGAHAVWGAIRERWAALGWETGPLGFPSTDELTPPDRYGRFNHFSGNGMPASIYWTGGTGAQAVVGAIRQRCEATGWETGPMGYPTTSESVTPDGIGRYNHFTGKGMPASIYYSPATWSQEIYGAIRYRWSALGWERSYLGYPTSGEFAAPNGRRNNFQYGYVFYDFRNGATIDRRY